MKKVLFICTGNSARSILAESILNKIGKKKFKALSAGSHPNGVVHPETLKFLMKKNYSIVKKRTDLLLEKAWLPDVKLEKGQNFLKKTWLQ